MSKARFLIVTRVGRQSLHSAWIDGVADLGIDTVLSAYQDISDHTRTGVTVEQRPGRKVEGYASFLRDRRDMWTQYDYICLLDEDLAASSDTFATAFDLAQRHRLLLSQPALTHDSYFTYAACVRQPVWDLRYVNFVEMMCPIFRVDALEQVTPLFEEGLESGIDLIWCNLLSDGPDSFAILDAAPIKHTEPVGQNKSANGFVGGREYEDDIAAVLRHFDLPWLSAVPFAGLTRSGRRVEGRGLLFLVALSLLFTIPRQPGWVARFRFVLTHLRHIVLRRPRNIPVVFRPGIVREA
ncbi:MAG: hypothetical protein AAFP98_02125 [Pseudomonadota bacterium]